jgi:hypothetical protein
MGRVESPARNAGSGFARGFMYGAKLPRSRNSAALSAMSVLVLAVSFAVFVGNCDAAFAEPDNRDSQAGVIGSGNLTEEQRSKLTDEERSHL